MTRTLPPAEPEKVGQTTTTPRNTPHAFERDAFTAELVDIDAEGWRTFHIADLRGYTKRHDTVRIFGRWVERESGGADVRGTIEVLRAPGWVELTTWDQRHDALARAFRILYGEEDHG